MMNTQKEPICRNELGMLAKLLATEDVFVEHKNVPTASFDTQNRVLTLPMWDKISHNLYHMLVLHEIGHALWTNADEWKDAVTTYPNLAGIINVIEDARIERRVKNKYPGSRRDFRIGYAELVQNNFFRIDPNKLDDLTLADRVNLHYKIGEHYKIPFSMAEMSIIREIDAIQTFAQVVDLAKRLGDLTKKNESGDKGQSETSSGGNQKSQGNPQPGSGEADPNSEGTSQEFDGESNSGTLDPNGDSRLGGKPGDQISQDADGGLSLDKDDLTAETVDALSKALDKLINHNAIPNQYMVAKYRKNWSRWVIPYKNVLENLARDRQHSEVAQAGHFQKTRRSAVRMVDYLIKEFEVRKAADEYVRTREAKSGVISPNRLHAYRMSDDIFRRVNIRPDAKNHGIMMFIDFSGSMTPNMSNTIDQLMNLVLFCRKANIPHRVYAFADTFDSLTGEKEPNRTWTYYHQKMQYGKEILCPDYSMRLVELFHETMTSNEFRQMIDHLKEAFKPCGYKERYSPNMFRLGGTPLDCALLLARPMLHDFKNETRTQLVSCVFLTDGGSGGPSIESESSNYTSRSSARGYGTVVIDPVKHRNYPLESNTQTKNGRECLTATLTQIIRDDGFRTVNFYVTGSKYEFRSACYSMGLDAKTLQRQFVNDGSYTLDNYMGFDQYYFIRNQNMNTSDNEDEDGEFSFEVQDGAKKGSIARAFINARSTRMDSRIVLKNFIKKIAA